MQATHPLPVTHPEFSVHEFSGCREYRIANWRLATDGSGKVIRGDNWLTWWDAWLPLLLSFLWPKVSRIGWTLPFIIALVLLFLRTKQNQIVYESLIVIPPHGIQLETHRGFSYLTNVTRRFIPLSALRDVIINEGLRGWNVRYYLAILRSSGEDISVDVAFENLLPRHPILVHVYRGVHELLFPKKPL